jgi:hypothetical protein
MKYYPFNCIQFTDDINIHKSNGGLIYNTTSFVVRKCINDKDNIECE